jgi:hypothetical protein
MIETLKPTDIGRFEARRDSGATSRYGTLILLLACVGVLVVLFIAGCSSSSQAHAVNPSVARESLKTALEQWKKGESPRSLATFATPMTVQDFDWIAGARLIDYQVVEDGKAYDANLRIRVKLTLSDPANANGKSAEKTVWYLVGTSPSVTVFRDALRR